MNENSDVQVKVERKRFSVQQLIDIEHGSLEALAVVAANCLVDDAGEYLPIDQATDIVRAMDGETFAAVCTEIMEALQNLPKVKRRH